MISEYTRVLASWRDEIDCQLKTAALQGGAEGEVASGELHRACEYVLSGGGKRLRGLLTCSVWGDLVGSRRNVGACRALSAAVSLEVLHAASLVHDDLPALDNDDLRRGKPSCHKAFNEATAILTGDVLVGAAVVHVSLDEGLSTDERARLVRIIGAAWRDLCVGQHLDLTQESLANTSAQRSMISLKTGALFGAAVACGALCAGEHDARLSDYYRWGVRVGECFQALDDLDDGDRPESDRARILKECGEVHAMSHSLHTALRGGVTSAVLSMIMPG